VKARQLRILQTLLFPLHGSGSGVYADKLAEFLTIRGHQVSVLCCDHYRPNRAFPVETILFSNGENTEFDLDFNFPAFTTHPLSQGMTFGDLTAAQKRAYTRAFREEIAHAVTRYDPDIVHVHHGWVIAPIVADTNIPYTISLHGTEHLGFEKYPRYRKAALRGLHGARLVMSHTEEDRQRAILSYGLAPQKIMVVRSGIDTGKFRPLQVDKPRLLRSYGISSPERPVVLFGGKLTAIKGVDVLLQGACIYSEIDPRPMTLLAGDGDARSDLQQMARELGLDSVHFLGHQSHRQMVHLYNIADVVVIPSSMESFPLVAMEALACGTPIVASDVGSLRQIVDDPLGYLVEPGDPVALAEKVISSIHERGKEKARHAAIDHVRRNLNWQNTVSDIESVYERCLAGLTGNG
jgi:glycosyltransferase involved in cell wall biosynthesis